MNKTESGVYQGHAAGSGSEPPAARPLGQRESTAANLRENALTRGYRVILAEDYVPFRDELKRIIRGIPEVELVAEVGEGNEFFELLKTLRPDLVISDISMPNFRAMKAIQTIKSSYPEIQVVIMVMDSEREYFTHAVAAGADGLLLKQSCAEDLVTAIRNLRRGEQYFPESREESRTVLV